MGKEDPEGRVKGGSGSSEFQGIPRDSLEGRMFRQGQLLMQRPRGSLTGVLATEVSVARVEQVRGGGNR